jgi:hypothetical protein
MGMIYRRGQMFWIKYYIGGRPIRESTGASIYASNPHVSTLNSSHAPVAQLDRAAVS